MLQGIFMIQNYVIIEGTFIVKNSGGNGLGMD